MAINVDFISANGVVVGIIMGVFDIFRVVIKIENVVIDVMVRETVCMAVIFNLVKIVNQLNWEKIMKVNEENTVVVINFVDIFGRV